jgi:hypothetical protein
MMHKLETPLSRSLSTTPIPESKAFSYEQFWENDPYYPGKNVKCELFEIKVKVSQNTDPEILIKLFEQIFRTDSYVRRTVAPHYVKPFEITVIEKGKGVFKWTDYKFVR